MGLLSRLTSLFRPKFSGNSVPPEDLGKHLRQMMLETPFSSVEPQPDTEFPHFYAVMMDMAINADTYASVFAAATGDASLYTTSAFNILGGSAHHAVRDAARKLVREANFHSERSNPAPQFPYPPADRVHFYLLGYSEVRLIETCLDELDIPGNPDATLFALGQNVLTTLRSHAMPEAHPPHRF